MSVPNSVEEWQIKLIYTTVYLSLGIMKDSPADLSRYFSKSIKQFLSTNPSLVVPESSPNVKAQDRFCSLTKAISTFKQELGDVPTSVALEKWRWMCREDSDKFVRRYIRQFGATTKAVSSIAYAIKFEVRYDGKRELQRGDRYYTEVEPDNNYIDQLVKGKAMVVGVDKIGRPVVDVRACLHLKKAQSKECLRRLVVLIFETVFMCQRDDRDGVVCVYDLTGWTSRNRDLGLLQFIIQNINKAFPNILADLYFHNAPRYFRATFSLVKPWIDPSVAARFHFTDTTEELLKVIPPDQLPRHLGGWSGIDAHAWISPSAKDDERMQDTEALAELEHEKAKLCKELEALTTAWVLGEDNQHLRKRVLKRYKANFWKMDPYVRSRVIWDRHGILQLSRSEITPVNATPAVTTSATTTADVTLEAPRRPHDDSMAGTSVVSDAGSLPSTLVEPNDKHEDVIPANVSPNVLC